jgi:hypothetical protein
VVHIWLTQKDQQAVVELWVKVVAEGEVHPKYFPQYQLQLTDKKKSKRKDQRKRKRSWSRMRAHKMHTRATTANPQLAKVTGLIPVS